jgi:hypothetical protein
VIEFGVPAPSEAASRLIIKLRFAGLTCAFAVEPRAGADWDSAPAQAARRAARDWCRASDLYEIFVRTFGFIRLTFAISGLTVAGCRFAIVWSHTVNRIVFSAARNSADSEQISRQRRYLPVAEGPGGLPSPEGYWSLSGPR